MPEHGPARRVLSEEEFAAVRQTVLDTAPPNLSEADFNRYVGPAFEDALARAEYSSTPLRGSAARRFLGGVWRNISPANLLPLVTQSPLTTAREIGRASMGQLLQALGSETVPEGLGHALAAVPLIGPPAAAAGERVGAGDIAGGLGEAVGLLAPFGVRPGLTAARALPRPNIQTLLPTLAERLERSAVTRLTDVMTPKVGPQKLRFGTKAQKIAPALLREPGLTAFSVEGLQTKIHGGFEQATTALDQVADARLTVRTFDMAPLVRDLVARRQQLVAAPVEGSRLVPGRAGPGGTVPLVRGRDPKTQRFMRRPVIEAPVVRDIPSGRMKPAPATFERPIGQEVVPAPNRARVAQLDEAIREVKTLGPVARYEPLRRIRQAFDAPAKAVYNPSITQDFMAKMGEKLGAADVTSVLREHLAQFDPATATANARYSLYKAANDVIEATMETERSRPRIGRRLVAAAAGAVAGAQAGGGLGAVAGVTLGALIERAVHLAPTLQISVARRLAAAADQIRAGNPIGARQLLLRIERQLPSVGTAALELMPRPESLIPAAEPE